MPTTPFPSIARVNAPPVLEIGTPFVLLALLSKALVDLAPLTWAVPVFALLSADARLNATPAPGEIPDICALLSADEFDSGGDCLGSCEGGVARGTERMDVKEVKRGRI